MALDGITVAAVASQLKGSILGGRISRVAQPEKDELLMTIKTYDGQCRLLISANAGLPLIYLTDKNKQSPAEAPVFLMLLRKHIGNGRIISVEQQGLERIIRIGIEHLDEMGDLRSIFLVIELMGKHSNIILVDENDTVIDSIRRVPANVSSVREVLPGRAYFVPDNIRKLGSLKVSEEEFCSVTCNAPASVAKALSSTLAGISPIMAEELCHRCGIDSNFPIQSLETAEREHLFHTFRRLMDETAEGHFRPMIYYKNGVPREFAAVPMTIFSDCEGHAFDSISEALRTYYEEKENTSRIRQKSYDLRHVISVSLDRVRRKYDLQLRQLKDTEKRDKYRVYGELIQTYGYSSYDGSDSMTAADFYNDNKEVRIPMDPSLSVSENAQRYFERYAKLKRTYEALITQTKDTQAELSHLESVRISLETAQDETDLAEIKRELTEAGYIRKHAASAKGGRKEKEKTKRGKPLHYRSSDGYDIYVGKNNYQNDELTFRFASGGDWWFHAKKQPGSHVVVKLPDPSIDPPARLFNEAGQLAAFYSAGKDADKVEIDYVKKREVKKPSGAKPGFVVYYTNYSMIATPSLEGLTLVEE